MSNGNVTPASNMVLAGWRGGPGPPPRRRPAVHVRLEGEDFVFEDCFSPRGIVGSTPTGTVVVVEKTDDGAFYLVKKLKVPFTDVPSAHRARRELKLQRRLRHPSIMEVESVMVADERGRRDLPPDIYLYMPLKHMHTTFDHLLLSQEAQNHVRESHHRFFMFHLLSGLAFMHSRRIVHGFIRPGTIWVSSNNDISISEFSSARIFPPPTADSPAADRDGSPPPPCLLAPSWTLSRSPDEQQGKEGRGQEKGKVGEERKEGVVPAYAWKDADSRWGTGRRRGESNGAICFKRAEKGGGDIGGSEGEKMDPPVSWVEGGTDSRLPLTEAKTRGDRSVSASRILTEAEELRGPSARESAGVLRYKAPECLWGCEESCVGFGADVWAAGCLLAEMLGCGVPLFSASFPLALLVGMTELFGLPSGDGARLEALGAGRETRAVLESVERAALREFEGERPPVTETLRRKYPDASTACLDLLSRLLPVDPDARLSAREALLHPWFTSAYNFPLVLESEIPQDKGGDGEGLQRREGGGFGGREEGA
uniref:Protein kinase domain-containing protein n=1 Tax=Chromera velia CCMP2878 TaxID=1169474 RepID=A0A0G4FF81_9ALVE|eukprot:Cvel_16687.t1-p1 / transcript=Cvel_16687.t1 / gene=Cvel_16687 / organism=Chromera_velia_CCMP2878 / gene_product=Mitogen-activated protein kinase 17, putative / transcript_product=Mitogen-activated protein kinase 17, putative / location=Cvel_scaffold1295:39805-41956(+) / protein_length=538 / sequence_SO=supercontig / SO=protein_coding / is_pseudo=false